MLKIGNFSRLSRISIRMLRHYDKIGILCPECVDDSTGYRYYSESQLPQAGKIQALKSMGFGLSVIKEMLEKYEDVSEMERFLLVKRKELEEEAMETRQKMRFLDSTLEWIRKDGNLMKLSFGVREIPERYVASVRKKISSYGDEGTLWDILFKELQKQDVKYPEECFAMAIFHDKVYTEKNPDVEIQIAVEGNYQSTDQVKFKMASGLKAASVVHYGNFANVLKMNENVADWVDKSEYDLDGKLFCVYYMNPANPDEMSSEGDHATEVCLTVK